MVKAFDLTGFEEGEEEFFEKDGTEEGPLSPFHLDRVVQFMENMSTAYITEANLHMRWPIHLLQLAIKDAINNHADIDKICSVRKSTLNTEETDKLGERPTPACVNRWSSHLRMTESVLKMFERDPQFQNKLTIPEHVKLTMNDVHQLQALTEVLLPLAEFTNYMQKVLGNLGIILPIVMQIIPLLSSVRETRSLSFRAFAETLSDNVSTHFNRFYSDKHLVLAGVLDPRFKTEWIIRDGTVSNQFAEIRELLVKEAERRAFGTSVGTAAKPRSGPKKARIFGSYESSSSVVDNARGEMEVYLGSLRKGMQEDVLGFWKTNDGSLPRLARVSRKIFSIPSGSSSAERVFSTAGLLSRAHCMSLKP